MSIKTAIIIAIVVVVVISLVIIFPGESYLAALMQGGGMF
jgi:hypothetical protein